MFIVNSYWFVSGTTYLLDTYTAAAAYSLRQLKTGVTSVVRVRRDSDNAESDFTATEITDGTLTTWTGANNGFVVTWYDQSGGGNNVTQSTAANQPRIVNAGTIDTKGGLPAVFFDGSNDRLTSGFTGAILGTSSTSYFSVSASNALATIGHIHAQSDNAFGYYIKTLCDTRTQKRHLIVTNTGATLYTADLSAQRNDYNQRLLSSFIDASKNMSAFDNGATGGTATYTGSVNNNGLQLGSEAAGSNYLNGYIQEFIGFNTDESANRTAIESDINTYYSIY